MSALLRFPRPAFPRTRAGWFALWLGALCLGVEAALAGADAGSWGSARWRPFAYQHGAFWAGLLADWRPNYALQPGTMFLSYAFLHGGAGHLVGNLAALWALVAVLGARLDAGRLALLWAGASAGGGVGFALLTQSPQPMVGASGALFGLAGAWVLWEAAELRTAGLSRWPVWRSLVLIVAAHPLFWVLQSGLLAWETHLGGFVVGAALARAIGPARVRRRRR